MTVTATPTVRGVVIHDAGKLALLLVVIVGLFAGLMVGRITEQVFVPFMTLVVGYLIGNGVNAARGTPGSPVLVRRSAEPALIVHDTPPAPPAGTMSADPTGAAYVDPGWPLADDL